MGSKPSKISASRGAAILGVNEYLTPVSVWLKIMEEEYPGFCQERGYVVPVDEDNAAMRWGRGFESAVAYCANMEMFSKKRMSLMGNREKFFTLKEFPFMTCHIDDQYSKKILHEGKTTWWKYFKANFGEPGTDRVPIEYQVQCQHQLICTGADEVILSVLVFPRAVTEFEAAGWTIEKTYESTDEDPEYILRNENKDPYGQHESSSPVCWADTLRDMGYFYQYRIRRNEKLIAKMKKNYSAWWKKHVIKKTEPPVKTYADIVALCPAPVGTIVADEKMERWISEYREITAEIGSTSPAAQRKDQLKVLILESAKKKSSGKKSVIDDDSVQKFVIKDGTGARLATFNGKIFRA